jgi:hypothetical protein
MLKTTCHYGLYAHTNLVLDHVVSYLITWFSSRRKDKFGRPNMARTSPPPERFDIIAKSNEILRIVFREPILTIVQALPFVIGSRG